MGTRTRAGGCVLHRLYALDQVVEYSRATVSCFSESLLLAALCLCGLQVRVKFARRTSGIPGCAGPAGARLQEGPAGRRRHGQGSAAAPGEAGTEPGLLHSAAGGHVAVSLCHAAADAGHVSVQCFTCHVAGTLHSTRAAAHLLWVRGCFLLFELGWLAVSCNVGVVWCGFRRLMSVPLVP